jgi:hypothetical protein
MNSKPGKHNDIFSAETGPGDCQHDRGLCGWENKAGLEKKDETEGKWALAITSARSTLRTESLRWRNNREIREALIWTSERSDL